ncbi:MAG: FGGY-family carbohydrate kinase [Bacteroidales bacterium]|jgi:sugar (pentulose or hexulose) kinase|nr:FGGY-family carbohydrate kinase [Bacteroidales bacterium]
MEENYILVIDAGTQSIRAVIIDLKGNICDIEKTTIEAYFSIEPGYAEQNPEYFWEKLCNTTKSLFARTKIDIKKIKGLSITSQRGTVINLDKNGKSLRPAILWLDQRKAKVENWPKGISKQGLKLINLYESITHAIKDGESNWIRQNQPEIWKKTNKFLLLSGYLTYKLCNKYVDSVGCTVGFLPFDYKTQKYSKSRSVNSKMFPIERNKLADLVQASELLGNITSQASEQTGIPEGLPIIAAAADKSCEVLGSGCISPEIACLSYGTTATIQTVNKKYVEVIKFFPPYPSAIPNYYNTEMMIYRGYWMINWFKQEFGHKEVELAKKTGKEPEELFDEMIKDVPPGSMGLTLQPYWSPGVKVPGVEAKGAIIGFGDVHKRSHLYRSILEGLAYSLKDGAMRTEKKTKVKIEKLRVSGGGSQSKNALQLTADIFNMPVEKPHTYETSALGAAINAAVGLKMYPDFESAIENMCRVGEVYYPIPENRDVYDKLYNRVYKKMYNKLKPLYMDIRSITNYPKKYED